MIFVQGLLSAFPAFSEGNSYEVLEGKVGYIKLDMLRGTTSKSATGVGLKIRFCNNYENLGRLKKLLVIP